VKTFISAADIEEMADQGVRELTVDEDTVLTAVARETAAQRGVKLVAPGTPTVGAASRPVAQAQAAAAPVVSGKPRGCQHGPIGSGPTAPAATSGSSPVVDELIGAVKQLARAPQAR
jgi:hypothetical protein